MSGLGPGAFAATHTGPRSKVYVGGTTYDIGWNEGRHTFDLSYNGQTALAKLLTAAEAVYARS